MYSCSNWRTKLTYIIKCNNKSNTRVDARWMCTYINLLFRWYIWIKYIYNILTVRFRYKRFSQYELNKYNYTRVTSSWKKEQVREITFNFCKNRLVKLLSKLRIKLQDCQIKNSRIAREYITRVSSRFITNIHDIILLEEVLLLETWARFFSNTAERNISSSKKR